MINKIIFTVTPIYSIPPNRAAAIESWIYHVAKRLDIDNRIVCIQNEGYSNYSYINEKCAIDRIKFGKIYTRLFKKWTRLDPYSYADRILKIKEKFVNDDEKSIIFVHNSIKLYKKIIKKENYKNVILHMHNFFEPKDVPEDIKMIVPSYTMRDWFRERLPHALIEVVRNGFDGDIYALPPEITRDELGLTAQDKVIFFAGRIAKDKGVLELMQSFNLLIKDNPNYKLVIAGDPDHAKKGEHKDYQTEVKNYAEQFGERCVFLGNIHPEKIRHFYSVADIIAVPSIAREPFCMVALEAMASGSPVIVSQRGAMVEFVKDKETGFIFREPLIAKNIAEDIHNALSDPNNEVISDTARKYVYETFTWEIVRDELIRVINKWYP